MQELSENLPILVTEEAQERSQIRRNPRSASSLQGGRVSMSLDDWLHMDRTLHELHTLVEVAIQQRDVATQEISTLRDIIASRDLAVDTMRQRLGEWKGFARRTEHRYFDALIENARLRHQLERTQQIAQDSLNLGPFATKRKKELGSRLEKLQERSAVNG